jgi:hypothetical protein
MLLLEGGYSTQQLLLLDAAGFSITQILILVPVCSSCRSTARLDGSTGQFFMRSWPESERSINNRKEEKTERLIFYLSVL